MLKLTYLIPGTVAAVLTVLAAWAWVAAQYEVIDSETHHMSPGSEVELAPVTMNTESLYQVRLSSDLIAQRDTLAIGAALVDSDGGAVFELEDSYWYETGTWKEDGESGTWEESNLTTALEFAVPEDGEYTLVVTLAGNRASLITMTLEKNDSPPPLSALPLLVGAGIFLVLAIFLFVNRARTQRRFVAKMREDSVIRVAGTRYTVTGLIRYRDPAGPSTLEWALRSDDGARFLSEAYFEYTRFDSEGDEYDRHQHVLLLEEPLSDEVLESLDAHADGVPEQVTFRGRTLRVDSVQSGPGTRESTSGSTAYRSYLFTEKSAPFPIGHVVLELTRDSEEGAKNEWAAMRILQTSEVELISLSTDEQKGRV